MPWFYRGFTLRNRDNENHHARNLADPLRMPKSLSSVLWVCEITSVFITGRVDARLPTFNLQQSFLQCLARERTDSNIAEATANCSVSRMNEVLNPSHTEEFSYIVAGPIKILRSCSSLPLLALESNPPPGLERLQWEDLKDAVLFNDKVRNRSFDGAFLFLYS